MLLYVATAVQCSRRYGILVDCSFWVVKCAVVALSWQDDTEAASIPSDTWAVGTITTRRPITLCHSDIDDFPLGMYASTVCQLYYSLYSIIVPV